MTTWLTSVGAASLQIAADVGGMARVLGRASRGLVGLRLDGDEFWRCMLSFGVASVPIVVAAAAFTGVIMVLQGAVYVEKLQAYSLTGWYTGFSTFREIGPVIIGLMFSGRVGANNTSELASMAATEQLDALRVLALDTFELLVRPRVVAMVASMFCLVVIGDAVAVGAGAVGARLLLGLGYEPFFRSMIDGLGPADFGVGVVKAMAFGLVVAVVSTHYGLVARGGSEGVGRAVHAQVVASAVGIFLVDYLLTSVWP